ncbi:alpha/beta fold hydrolase [Nocardia yunnanensis]|uniref:Alpha/beta fold hydrolase n=1 Tax=Nocardia yunnanensis TaxID=2382165 RepID=A0A386ZDH6_9NOCA|nr:alpha/beta fold hydrolase [Nocardia yunnanensis]AYF75922.1 alpha/beta fold hydrolase [Nocardia yunnanensis]
MSQAPITPVTLRGAAGELAGWQAEPPAEVAARGTVLLVPGFTGSKEDFEGMLPLLAAAGYRAVAYDQRGQWQSEGPEDVSGYTMADFVGDLQGVVDQISPDAPIHLVGHSFGGYVSRVAVVERPGRFRSFTLLASGPSSVEDIDFPPPQLVAQLVESGGQELIWQQMSAALFESGHTPPPERMEFLHRRILQTKRDNILGILHCMTEPPLKDPAALRDSGVPLLVAYGDTNDLWAPAVHEKFARALGAETVVFPGSGHVPNEDVPDKVCAALETFWKGTGMTDIDTLLAKLDLPAKIRLISGANFFRFAGEDSIGLAEMPVSDGPSGVRGEQWDERDPSVSLPSGTALAATWDRELLGEIGALIAAEARRKDVYAVLGPTINLHRSPLGGRHFECFSEDPMLTAEIADAYVRAVQAHGVSACPKHYVANDSETERFTTDVLADERTLRELYLYPFERSVAAGAWMIMAAYNSVNGVTMTENDLLDEPLKGEWGFDGVVVSDWTAVRSTAGAAKGTDLAMPGPWELWGAPLEQAVRTGEVPESAIDEKVRRILRFAVRVGALQGSPQPVPPVTDDAAQRLVREAAAKAMVLARNDGILPLGRPARVALLGSAAAEPRFMGGGSATVIPAHTTSPLEGLSEVLPVVHTPGVHLSDAMIPVPVELVTDPATGTAGLSLRYFDGDTVLDTEHRAAGSLMLFGNPNAARATAIELHGSLRADTAGEWRIGFAGVGDMTLSLDGEQVLTDTVLPEGTDPVELLLNPPQRFVTRDLAEGQQVEVLVRMVPAGGFPALGLTCAVGRPRRAADEEFAAAVELARTSEVAVVVVGTTEQIESEGYDRTTLALPGRQDELVAAVAAVNPRTIVVVNSGSPVEMPWRDDVAAVLLTWFPGQEFGAALADVLTGAREPGGRLPTTWPKAMADVPVLNTKPGADHTLPYTEGIHIGYRAWLKSGVAPAYPFGHGLGYTTWALDDLTVSGRTATVTVRNTGARRGRQVLQAYLSREHSAVDRPVRWLSGFAVVEADAGESVTATIELPKRSFQHWTDAGWAVEPGVFTLHVGTSVTDLPLTAEIG